MNQETSISHGSKGPEHSTVFIWIFALSAIWHYTSSSDDIVRYWLNFDPFLTPVTLLSVGTAIVAALFPSKTWALLIFATGQLVAIVLRMPFVADHLVMELFLNLSILLSYAYLAITRKTFAISNTDTFALFGPIGRWLLIIMYFFGTFHKINPGFLSAVSSCALPFTNGLPLPQGLLDQGWFQYIAIYGVLILELIAMLLLLSTRTKYWGMLLGMTFHFIIGISTYGTMAHFSAFALALHTLFLPSGFGQRVIDDPIVPAELKSSTKFRYATITLLVLQFAFAINMGLTGRGFMVNALFSAFAIVLLFMVFKHGQMKPNDAPYRLKSPLLPMNLLSVWFFLHCLSPYVGLGSGGSLAMFSGLRTEGGISNHYIITKPIPLFSYQDEIVYIENATNQSLINAAAEGQGIVMFDFQRHFTQRETLLLPLQIRVGDKQFSFRTAESVGAFVDEYFTDQSLLERKYMSFRLVDEPQPNQCRH